jgi:hypothetical protein
LRKSYKVWSKNLIPSSKQEDDNNEDFINEFAALNQEERNVERVQVTQDVMDKVYHQVKCLESSFNLEASKIIESIDQGREITLDQANIALFSGSIQV